MAVFNQFQKELECKIVYYGPGLSGKTVSLEQLMARSSKRAVGRTVILASECNHPLYFDYLPLSLGRIRGIKIHLGLYSVPGQAPFATSRKLILKDADGIVFVADSHLERLETDLDSVLELRSNLIRLGVDPATIPMVMQYNKRDLPHAASPEKMSALFNPDHHPEFLTVAPQGVGIREALKEIAGLVVSQVAQQIRRAAPAHRS